MIKTFCRKLKNENREIKSRNFITDGEVNQFILSITSSYRQRAFDNYLDTFLDAIESIFVYDKEQNILTEEEAHALINAGNIIYEIMKGRKNFKQKKYHPSLRDKINRFIKRLQTQRK